MTSSRCSTVRPCGCDATPTSIATLLVSSTAFVRRSSSSVNVTPQPAVRRTWRRKPSARKSNGDRPSSPGAEELEAELALANAKADDERRAAEALAAERSHRLAELARLEQEATQRRIDEERARVAEIVESQAAREREAEAAAGTRRGTAARARRRTACGTRMRRSSTTNRSRSQTSSPRRTSSTVRRRARDAERCRD